MLLFLFIIIYALLGMQIYGGQFNLRNNEIRISFDDFEQAFFSIFQLLTMENWQEIIILTFRTDVNKFLTALYLISWIFIGNFVFLNLFLAILLDGFTSKEADEDLNYEEVEED